MQSAELKLNEQKQNSEHIIQWFDDAEIEWNWHAHTVVCLLIQSDQTKRAKTSHRHTLKEGGFELE